MAGVLRHMSFDANLSDLFRQVGQILTPVIPCDLGSPSIRVPILVMEPCCTSWQERVGSLSNHHKADSSLPTSSASSRLSVEIHAAGRARSQVASFETSATKSTCI